MTLFNTDNSFHFQVETLFTNFHDRRKSLVGKLSKCKTKVEKLEAHKQEEEEKTVEKVPSIVSSSSSSSDELDEEEEEQTYVLCGYFSFV